jgi:hypothetical protein
VLSKEKFEKNEIEYGCGYWFECCDRACPCAITTENKGLTQAIWDGFKKEQKELSEQYDPNELNYTDDGFYDDEEYEEDGMGPCG